MEKLIKQFLNINGNGDGDGNGNGYGDGDGNGYGNGYGDGDGDGNGNGNGYGDGNGDGNGNGNGYGDGNGNGDGDGDGYGIKLSTFHGNKVYNIDSIPGVFRSIKGNIALLDCINIADFSAEQMYVVKKGNFFAHGRSIKEAEESVNEKYYSNLDKETVIAEFKQHFIPTVSYPNSEFYKWHTLLTGSCAAGKDLFMKQVGVTIDGAMTVDEFLKITENAYGGEVIRQIKY